MGTPACQPGQGVYGQLKDNAVEEQKLTGEIVQVAMKQEVQTGPVQIFDYS